MTVPPTESGEGDPGQVTRIAEEFIRLHEGGKLTDLDEFCARYPEDQRAHVRQECEQLLRLHGVIVQHDPLRPGQVLGSYEIVASIGKGGMGEVYRARDMELDRDIAIKVLPPELACHPERVKRFKREAKAIAALDHPNIVTIYSVEEVDGLHFITMQLVQGKTLAEVIPRKGLVLEKFFDVAIPLADAISSAHAQGVTHRDLKPANIMVTLEGRVEILDFGLAKLTQATGPERSTKLRLTPLTGEGQIVGTVAYMSPEQAEGRDVDHRTDIFSLGIVLYEMVAGERPFKGETRLALMSSIMKDTPTSVTEVNRSLPRHLGRIVRRCLAKDVGQRYQTATDLRNELTELRREVESGEIEVATGHRDGGRRWLWPAVSGALVVALVLMATQIFAGEDRDPTVAEVRVLTDQTGNQHWPSLSPDGRTLLYFDGTSGNRDVYAKRLTGESRNITVDHLGQDSHAVFDPSGDRIAFRSEREGGGIFVMGAGGEDPIPIVSTGFDPQWSPDGKQLVYGNVNTPDPYFRAGLQLGEIWVVDLETGEEKALYAEGVMDAYHPSWSPNDKRIAFAGEVGGQRDIWTLPKSGGEPVALVDDVHTDWGPVWSPDGRFIYFISDRGPRGKADLWRVRVDEDSGEMEGEPEEVWAPTRGRVKEVSISGDNIVCTVEETNSWIGKIGFDPDTGTVLGEEEEIYSTFNDDLTGLSLSPEGQWLAFARQRGVEDVFIVRPDGSDLPRNLTDDLDNDRGPTWYPDLVDGVEWLTFFSNREMPDYQVWRIRPNGTGLHRLTDGLAALQPRWLDGSRLSVFRSPSPGVGERKIFEFPNGLDEPPIGNLPASFVVLRDTSWSPDRQLVAHGLPGGRLLVNSVDASRRIRHLVRDADGVPYRTPPQTGSRWLDDQRLIFWNRDQRRALLWDVISETEREIEGIEIEGLVAEFVFSNNGDEIFMLRKNITSDIFLLEMSR